MCAGSAGAVGATRKTVSGSSLWARPANAYCCQFDYRMDAGKTGWVAAVAGQVALASASAGISNTASFTGSPKTMRSYSFQFEVPTGEDARLLIGSVGEGEFVIDNVHLMQILRVPTLHYEDL